MSKTEEEPFVNENGLPSLSSLFHLPFVAINNIYLTFTKTSILHSQNCQKRQSQDIYLIFTLIQHSQNCPTIHSKNNYSTFTKLPKKTFTKLQESISKFEKTESPNGLQKTKKNLFVFEHICKIVFLIPLWGNDAVKVKLLLLLIFLEAFFTEERRDINQSWLICGQS